MVQETSRRAKMVVFLDGREAEDWRAMTADRELADAELGDRDQLDLPKRSLCFATINSFDLLMTNCPCGELAIHGFYHQLEWDVDWLRMRAVAVVNCSGCGRAKVKRYGVVVR